MKRTKDMRVKIYFSYPLDKRKHSIYEVHGLIGS